MQWDSDLLEFLMRGSVTEKFTLSLAETVTGNCHALELLERALEAGNFLSCRDDIYCMHPILVKALNRHAAKTLGPDMLKNHAYNAGLWYEMQGQIVPALGMFEKCGNKECILCKGRTEEGSVKQAFLS